MKWIKSENDSAIKPLEYEEINNGFVILRKNFVFVSATEERGDHWTYLECQMLKADYIKSVADRNIQKDSYFSVGEKMYLSTVAIAQGSTIIPGTNCTEISLADALNSLNS